MDFRILGALEVEDRGESLPLGGHQQRALLALLLLRANEVVSVDEIIDDLWAAEPPPSATKSVHALISKLRARLENEPAGPDVEGGENGVLLTRPHGYVLTVASGELDLHRFQSLVDEGQQALSDGRADDAAAKLRQGLALWRGPPLAEFAYDPFAQVEIARLEELRLSAVEERIEADLALGRHHDLISELEALVARHPLRERLRGQLMLALYRSGRQAEALDAYQRARRTLVDELGYRAEPGAAAARGPDPQSRPGARTAAPRRATRAHRARAPIARRAPPARRRCGGGRDRRNPRPCPRRRIAARPCRRGRRAQCEDGQARRARCGRLETYSDRIRRKCASPLGVGSERGRPDLVPDRPDDAETEWSRHQPRSDSSRARSRLRLGLGARQGCASAPARRSRHRPRTRRRFHFLWRPGTSPPA